ncbi:hypothetical protein MBANPS3_008551 [Mucor bainieri]
MKHASPSLLLSKNKTKEGLVRVDKRKIRILIPLAYKDEKLALATDTDGATTVNNKPARPQHESGRTFHCSVCNTTLESKADYEDHIIQTHRKSSIKKQSYHSTLSVTNSIKTSIDSNKLAARNKTMNPAKIVDHSGLIYAESRLMRARYRHHAHAFSSSNVTRKQNHSIKSETSISLTDGSSQATGMHNNNNAVIDTSCQTATISATETLGRVSNGHCSSSCKSALNPDKLQQCSVRSRYTAPQHKKRKLSAASDMIDIEVEDQKMRRALSECSQRSQAEVEINPIISNVSSHPHPVINDPNNYCRVCHVSHSTQEAYQVHLQTEHHVAFPSLSTKRKAQNSPAITRFDKLCKYIPIQITFDPKPSSLKANREQMKDANVLPDIDDPNHYCRSCHITKPSRTSYLTHLCMIHQITRRKSKESKASKRKSKIEK